MKYSNFIPKIFSDSIAAFGTYKAKHFEYKMHHCFSVLSFVGKWRNNARFFLLTCIILSNFINICFFSNQCFSQTNKISKVEHKTDPPVHQYIAWQAMQLLEGNKNYTEMFDHLGDCKTYNFYMLGEIITGNDDIGYSICEGAEEEDQWGNSGIFLIKKPDTPGKYESTYFTHFWNPNGGYVDGLTYDERQYLSAVQKAQYYWSEKVIPFYENGYKKQAYYWLGHIAHLLTDMSVPAHVHEDIHAPFPGYNADDYEDYMVMKITYDSERNYKQWDHLDGTKVDYNNLPLSPDPSNYNYDNLPTIVDDINDWDEIALFKLFVNLAEEADNFDSCGDIAGGDIGVGEIDKGSRRDALGHITPDECKEIGNTLMPLAISYVAGLYQLFWDATHQPEQGAYVSISDYIWDDDDGDGFLEANEGVELKINLTSDSNIDNVRTVLETTDSSIIITDSDTFYQNGIKAGEDNWPYEWFGIKFNFDNNKGCEFTLKLSYEINGSEYYQDIDFFEVVEAQQDWGAFAVEGIEIDDSKEISDNNNEDGFFQSGERVLVSPIIKNTGSAIATKIDVTLTYEGEEILISGEERYPDLTSGESAVPNTPFTVEAVKSYSGDSNIDVKIVCEENSSIIENSLQLTVEPEAWMDLSENKWDFGTVKPGNDIVGELSITNYGTKAMIITSVEISHDDTDIDTSDLPWNINPGESRNVEITLNTENLNGDIERSIKFSSDGRIKEPDVDNLLIITGSVNEIVPSYYIDNTAGIYRFDLSGNMIVWREDVIFRAYDISNSSTYDINTNGAGNSFRISGNNIVWSDLRNWDGSGEVISDLYGYNLDTNQEYSILIDSQLKKYLIGIDGLKVLYAKQYYTFSESSVSKFLYDLWMYNIGTNTHTNITNYSWSDNPKKTVDPNDGDVCNGKVVWKETPYYWNTDYNQWQQNVSNIKVFSMNFNNMIPEEIGLYRTNDNLKTNGDKISWSYDPDDDEMWLLDNENITHWHDPDIDFRFPVLGDNYMVYTEKISGQPRQLIALDLNNYEEKLLVTESNNFVEDNSRMDGDVIVWQDTNPNGINYSFLNGMPPNIEIQLRPRIEISTTNINMGNTSTGYSSYDYFSISNTGNEDLIISSIESSNAAFEVVSASEAIAIPPGDEKNFKIIFTPADVGLIEGSIAISNNDTLQSININGVGTEPIFSIYPQTIEFDESIIGLSYSDSIIINNSGNVELPINNISSDNEVFLIDKNSATILPDSNLVININYTPTEIGDDIGTINIISADDTTSVILKGSARLLDPPSNLELQHLKDEEGNGIELNWVVSSDDLIISDYYIYRSKNPEYTQVLFLEDLNEEELIDAERNYTIRIASVPAGENSFIDYLEQTNGDVYYYWLRSGGSNGISEIAEAGSVTSLAENIPKAFKVNAPYPNPFNPNVVIEYMIPENCIVKIAIYDILGRKVAVIQDNELEAGIHKTVWDGRTNNGNITASGVYFYRITAGLNIASGKITLLK